MPVVGKGAQHFIMKSQCGQDFHEKSQRTIDMKFRLHMRTCDKCKGVKFVGINYKHESGVFVLANGNSDYLNHGSKDFVYSKTV